MKHSFRVVAMSFALLCVAACAGSSSTTRSASAPRRSANLITVEEIGTTTATNVYDAIERLRPQWLTTARQRGGSSDELQVYLDATRYGSLTSLRSLSVGGVQEVHFFSASEATNRYGTGHTGGAILVRMAK